MVKETLDPEKLAQMRIDAAAKAKGGKGGKRGKRKRQGREPPQENNQGAKFETDEKGNIIASSWNVDFAVSKLGITFRHDVFADRDLIAGFNGHEEEKLTDDIECMIRKKMDDLFEFRISAPNFRDKTHAMALENSFHPVKDYLENCGAEYDGTASIDTWAIDYCGVEDSPLNRAISSIVMMAAVKRIYEPGCKFDELTILNDETQGTEKSGAWSTLAVKDDWFCDSLSLNCSVKELMEQLKGKWITESPEVLGLQDRSSSRHTKAMLSRRFDKARAAYGRIPDDRGREGILVGTANETELFSDFTGNRRYWVLKTKAINLKGLVAVRDRLWAEAYVRVMAGASIRLDRSLRGAAAKVQEAHMERNPFTDRLAVLLNGFNDHRVKSQTIMDTLNIPIERQRGIIPREVKAAMTTLGWKHSQSNKFGEINVSGYRKDKDKDNPASLELVMLTRDDGYGGKSFALAEAVPTKTKDENTGTEEAPTTDNVIQMDIGFGPGFYSNGQMIRQRWLRSSWLSAGIKHQR